MQVLIIADDLTGALDSAAALTGAGLRCLVARRPEDAAAALRRGPDVLAVSTASREGGVAAARAAVRAAVAAAGAPPAVVFKKVDSRLKGHVAAETAALAGWAGRGRALVAPAIPAQGRTVAGGRLIGAGVAAPIDVAAAFAGAGPDPAMPDLDIPDTACDADLDAALERAFDRSVNGPPALLVGAAGLAAALARRLGAAPGAAAAPVRRLPGPILLAIGSRDPITLAQVEALAARGGVACEAAPDGACAAAGTGQAGTEQAGARLVRLVAAEGRPFDPAGAGARFAEGVAARIRAEGTRSLLACGGETADAILGALGAGVLELAGEVLPGAPVSTMMLGDRPLRLVTKSGGFGGTEALVSIVEAAECRESAG